MNSIQALFTGTGTASTIIFISLTAVLGIVIGKLELKKIKLGIAGVLFMGLLLAHLGAQLNTHVLHFIREFGLILFVYAIGVDVGPRFFSSLRNEGLKLNILAAGVTLLGFGIAYTIFITSGLPSATVTGIMCGAVTNTPGLGAAQQVINEQALPALGSADTAAMAYAVAYPFGIIGIILAMLIIRWMFNIKVNKEIEQYTDSLNQGGGKLETVKIRITNPNMYNKEISYIKEFIDKELAVSRIERGEGNFIIPTEKQIIQNGDILYGVSSVSNIENLELKLGKIEIVEKQEISGDLTMTHILITNKKIVGKTIREIGIYRRYDANITRIFRAGMELLPTLDTTIERGDTVRIVGKKALLDEIRKELGNSVKELAIPNTVPIFLGIILGLLLGSIPIFIPGLPAPAKLGMAGGPLLIAILLGHKGRIGKLDFYMTPGANMMLREIGIILFLAAVGLSSGGKFVQTITEGGMMWMVYGAAITFFPITIIGVIARIMKMNYLKICGLISGAMTDPPALEFANSIAPVQAQSTAYATVYPLTMFLRVLLAQILILSTL